MQCSAMLVPAQRPHPEPGPYRAPPPTHARRQSQRERAGLPCRGRSRMLMRAVALHATCGHAGMRPHLRSGVAVLCCCRLVHGPAGRHTAPRRPTSTTRMRCGTCPTRCTPSSSGTASTGAHACAVQLPYDGLPTWGRSAAAVRAASMQTCFVDTMHVQHWKCSMRCGTESAPWLCTQLGGWAPAFVDGWCQHKPCRCAAAAASRAARLRPGGLESCVPAPCPCRSSRPSRPLPWSGVAWLID